MSESDPQTVSEDDALRKRLLNRIAVAGVIIVGLLAGLAAFDALIMPSAPTQQARIEEAPILTPSKPFGLPKPEEAAPPVEKSAQPAEPERSSAPEAEPLPEPKGVRPLTVPATAKPAIHKPTPAAPAAPPPAVQELAAEPTAPAGPIARAIRSVRQYVLQLGVFSNPVNAEELRAKLNQAGIPAQIESRVQVGPFKTKKEAEETRQKLIALGVEPGIVLAVRK